MKSVVVPKPKWFKRATKPGEILVGKDVVRIGNGCAIDYSMNNDDNHGSYRISHTGEILNGKSLINIENGDVIDHATNNNGGDSNSYRHQQGYGILQEEGYDQFEVYKERQIHSSKRKRETESSKLHFNSHQRRDSISENKKNDHVSEKAGFGFLMRENDCLDTTFNSIEKYTCKETTSERLSARTRSYSPTVPYIQKRVLNDGSKICDKNISDEEKSGKNTDVYEEMAGSNDEFGHTNDSSNSVVDHTSTIGYCSSRNDGFRFIAGKIGELLLPKENHSSSEIQNESGNDYLKNHATNNASKTFSTERNSTDMDSELSQRNDKSTFTLNQTAIHDFDQTEQIKSDAFSSRMNRENSILDVEPADNSGEQNVSTAPLEKVKPDRLEQLRRNKRNIEQERISQNQSQTIVIPRSSLYRSEEDIEEPKSYRSRRKLEVGSSVTTKQAKNIYLLRKLALIATIFLISVGTVILAVALFWPARIL